MKRPLVKRIKGEPGWVMRVREMPHQKGISYPVFEWAFCHKGICGGTLRAWSLQATLVFEDTRESSGDWKFTSVEEALRKIDEYGWGELPLIDEIFQDLLDIKGEFPVDSLDRAKKIFDEFRGKWESMIAGYRPDDKQYQQKSRDFWERQLADMDLDL